MAKFEVTIYEVWARTLTVDAETEEEAKSAANTSIEAGDEDGLFEYSHTKDVDDWNVNKLG